MSYSNPRTVNPVQKFIQFKGDTGEFVYFDKETEKNIKVDMPIYFVVLDELTTIKGFSELMKSGIYSNEISDLRHETLNVRSFKGHLNIVGKYNDIKHEIKANGGKFCKSVYAMLIKGKNDYEQVNFQLTGAAFSAWLDKKFNTEQYGVIVKDVQQEKKGSIDYFIPKFGRLNVNTGVDKAAKDMDAKLQDYLTAYKNRQMETLDNVYQTKDDNPTNNDNPVNVTQQAKSENQIAAEMYSKTEHQPDDEPQVYKEDYYPPHYDEGDDLPF
jgi:hypothetical protein